MSAREGTFFDFVAAAESCGGDVRKKNSAFVFVSRGSASFSSTTKAETNTYTGRRMHQ